MYAQHYKIIFIIKFYQIFMFVLCFWSVDYEKVNLASKIGGVCDIDQIYILNSNDGPTTGQCGTLTGYSSKSFPRTITHYYDIVKYIY